MASTTFSKEEKKQDIKSIEKQVKYLEETERELKTTMSTDEENALREEARNLEKLVPFHKRLFNSHCDLLSDVRLKREAYSLRAQKSRAELLKSKGVQLVQNKYNRDEIRIVLNGKTRKGKSALGNNLLGYDHFRCRASLKGITMKCKYGVRYLDEEYKLLVVDTHGLFDSEKPNEEMSKEITKCVGLAAPGPHVFIFVVSTERFSPEEMETLTNLQKLFGEKVIDHVIIVFTKKEHLEDQGIMEFMRDADDILLDLLVKCKFRFAFINNRADPDDVRVDIDVILDLIFKTIGENDGNYYSYKDDIIERMIKEKEIEKEMEIQQLKEQKQKLMDEHQEKTGLKSMNKEKKPQKLEEEERKPQDELAGFKKVEAEIHDVGATLREISIFLKQLNIGNEESGIEKIEEKYNNIHKLFSDQSKTDSEPSNNEYISILIREVRGLKQKVNDLMTFLRENKTQKRSKEFAEESYIDSDKTGQRMDSMEDRISQPMINTVNVNSRKEKVLEIDKRIKELENINVYFEVRKEIEKGETTKTFTQKVMEAAGVGAGVATGVLAGTALAASAPVVATGAGVAAVGASIVAGVAKETSWLKSWW